jgi:hypothetical protein
MRNQMAGAALAVSLLAIGAASMPAGAKDCKQKSTLPRPIELGVSGGNINSFVTIGKKQFCFSGTLGSMVQDQGANQFILSNNHVLARTNIAQTGEPIVQPGLAVKHCQVIPTDEVATFSSTVQLDFSGGTNTVDAAIAAVDSGDVNSNILNIGPIASTVATATVGLKVQKMGATTCLTTGKISAVGVSGQISYGGGQIANFANQIIINHKGFGKAGDSGSLIVTRDACPQAVALLFAGSKNFKQTIANPISDVLSDLGVSMTGGCSAAAAAPQAVGQAASATVAENATVAKDLADSATAVRDRHEHDLMSIPGAVGTGIGASDKPGRPAIEVYLDKITPEAQAAAPKEVEGLPVKLIENGGFVAY